MIHLDGGILITGQSLPYSEKILKDTSLLMKNDWEKKKISSFLISSTEVTNAEWRLFFNAQVKELGYKKAKELFYPDTLCLRGLPYTYGEPYVSSYFLHPAYDDYPIVGISWYQANAYCKWLSKRVGEYLKNKGIDETVEFRLPTEKEWEYASISWSFYNSKKIKKYSYFYKPHLYASSKGIGKQEYSFAFDFSISNFNDPEGIVCGTIRDEYNNIMKKGRRSSDFNAPVQSHKKNKKGIYHIIGNVAEWTSSVGTLDSISNLFTIEDTPETIYKEITKQFKIDSLKKAEPHRDFSYLKYWEMDAKCIHRDIQLLYRYQENRIVKGGSFADPYIYLIPSTREIQNPNTQSMRIGSRIVMTYNSNLEKYYKKLGIQK